MKKTPANKTRKDQDMAPEYRFAERMKNEPLVGLIEPDIAKVFYFSRTGKQSITRFDFSHT
jgi:hypothetical protein